jgi:hypothetical protein
MNDVALHAKDRNRGGKAPARVDGDAVSESKKALKPVKVFRQRSFSGASVCGKAL